MIFVYFVFLIFSVIAGVRDALSSQNFIYYNGSEGGFVKDQYGYHSNIKELYIWGPIYGVGFVLPFLPFFTQDQTSFWIGSVIYGVIGGYRLNESFRNRKLDRDGRAKQLVIVQNIKAALATGDEQAVANVFDSMLLIGEGGRSAYGEFGWLYSTNPDVNGAVLECRALVIAWVKAGAIFPK